MTAATPAARRSAERFVLIAVLVDAMGYGIVMPVLPDIVMTLGHMSLARATEIGGWLGVIYAAVQFVTGPLVGNLGDRFGRRPVLLGALGGFTIDYALMGFAPSLWWLFAGRALAGLFGASYGPAGAALADISAPEERARVFGLLGAAFGIGFVAGPALGGLLGELGPRAPFHAAAALAGFNFLFGLVAFPETLPADHRRPFEWRRANPLGALMSLKELPGVLGAASAAFWWNLASMIYPVCWSFYAIAAFGWSPGVIGASLAWVGILMALSQTFLVGRIVSRFGERGAAAIGIGAGVIEFMLFAMIREGWMVFVVMLILPLQSCAMPALNGLMSRAVPANRQGELQGFGGSLAAIAAILAPALFNPALAYFTGPDAPVHFVGAPFVLAAGAAAVAVVILLRLREPRDAGATATTPLSATS